MGIFSTPTITIVGFILSFLGNITQFRTYRKLRAQKIETANKEILDSLLSPVLDKSIPRRSDITNLINATSIKYKLKKKELHDINTFFDLAMKHVYDNPALQSKDKNELAKLIRGEQKIDVLQEGEERKEIPKKKSVQEQFFAGKKTTIFSDDFEQSFEWQNYKDGKVSKSKDFSHSGQNSLKKDLKGDPHGGFRKLTENMKFVEGVEFLFSGWIYRPLVATTSYGDRLAIEDTNFCGYGFCVNHLQNIISIERRDNGRYTPISIPFGYNPPKNRWYKFEFHMRSKGIFSIYIYDESGGIDVKLDSFIDKKYSLFDRVVVHGGFPFYVDDLKIEIVE